MSNRVLCQFLVGILVAGSMSNAMAQESTKATTNKTAAAPASATKTVDPSTIPDNEFFLTNGTWEKGIHRVEAAFFVKYTPDNIEQYVQGNTVVFPNGDKRTITNSRKNPPYIEVRVSGDIFTSAAAGLPSKFKVIVNAEKKPTDAPKTEHTQKSAGKTVKPTEKAFLK